MELLYLLFGSVNYPDVQIPAQLTINIFFLCILLFSNNWHHVPEHDACASV